VQLYHNRFVEKFFNHQNLIFHAIGGNTRTGQKKTVTDAAGQRTFSYTDKMQREAETLPSAFYGDKVLTNKYEASSATVEGRDKGFKLGTATDPDADMEVTYGYSAKGRFDSVTDSNGTYSYSYVTDSNMIGTTTYPNNLSATRSYEGNRNLVDYVENDVDGTTISKYDYTNDAAGRRTDVDRSGTAFEATDTLNYNYNARSEVTGAQSTVDDSYDYSYAYDNIGNRLESSTGILPVRNYTTNDLNQYTAVSDLTDPTHDADGNMTLMPTSNGDWNMTWNAENRLIEAVENTAEDGSKKLEFTYDYKGRRIRKQVYDWQTDHWSLITDNKFVYDGWNLIYTEKTDHISQSTSYMSYTWGLDLSGDLQGAGGVGGLLCVTENPASSTKNPYYPSYDANGNISEYVDDSDSVVAHYEYSPFGKLTSSNGSKSGDFRHRFSTKYQDAETALYYYGYRYYSSELGRWLNRDPKEESGGLNLYVFVGNNGVNIWDLLGKSPKKDSDCKGQWSSFRTFAKYSGDKWVEAGSGDISWYGVSALKVCIGVEIGAKGSVKCNSCCSKSRISGKVVAGPVKDVCVNAEVPWTAAVGAAALAGAPVPGSRIVMAGAIGAFGTRVLQKLLRTYKRLDTVIEAKETFEEKIRNDTAIPSSICKGNL